MSVRILRDAETGYACLYCSTAMVAFGPVFVDEETAARFLAFLPKGADPRTYSPAELAQAYSRFCCPNPASPPYPQFCYTPAFCAGRSYCPKDPTCID